QGQTGADQQRREFITFFLLNLQIVVHGASSVCPCPAYSRRVTQRFDFRQEIARRYCDKLSQPGEGQMRVRKSQARQLFLGARQIAARQFATFPTPVIWTRIRAH
ncbi:MAG: hypothetical protein ACOYB3_13470, partial [Azonexus sp.]